MNLSNSQRGLCGLQNIGNSCYLNACLQCLSATDILISYFSCKIYKKDLKKGIIRESKKEIIDAKEIKKLFRKSLTYQLRNILIIMWGVNSGSRYKPVKFRYKLGEVNQIFSDRAQHDAQECMGAILDAIHEESKTDVRTEIINLSEQLQEYATNKYKYDEVIADSNIIDEDKKQLKHAFNQYKLENLHLVAELQSLKDKQNMLKKNHSIITDIFTGLYFNEVICQNCNIPSFRFDTFTSLNPSIPQGNSSIKLNECFDNFSQPEIMTGSNSYWCEVCCSKQTASKTLSVWKSPPRMIIQLKRFINDGMRFHKNSRHVEFPIRGFELQNCMSKYSDKGDIYDLYAVIKHMGNMGGGHYLACTQNPLNDEWYLYDDDKIIKLPTENLHNILADNAYMLFYKKRKQVKIFDFLGDCVKA